MIALIFGNSAGSSVLHWLEQHFFACPFKQTFGVDCPGCGIQRSIVALFRGDLATSVKLYPATIPLIALLLFALLHIKFDFNKGAFLIKVLYSSVAIIILINYIYKILTNQLI